MSLMKKMVVPRASLLGPGVAVNIVLKADQPTGRLTTGKIQDLLSRGDHPRGIKVRLQDGQVGRVQSLASDTGTAASSSNQAQPTITNSSLQSRHFRFQEDYRNTDAVPPSPERSLDDFIKIKPMRKKGKKTKMTSSEDQASAPETDDIQATLQKEFPSIDSSLIAAILGDSDDVESARTTLNVLSAT